MVSRTTATEALPRELAHRSGDGLDVALVWNRTEDRVEVLVEDVRFTLSFRIVVEDGEDALEVFRHPFAYAAFHGLRLEAAASAERELSSGPSPDGKPLRFPPAVS